MVRFRLYVSVENTFKKLFVELNCTRYKVPLGLLLEFQLTVMLEPPTALNVLAAVKGTTANVLLLAKLVYELKVPSLLYAAAWK